MSVTDIPAINACFNGIATILICSGFVVVQRAKRQADPAKRAGLGRVHRNFMLGSALASALFLVGYVTYHGMRRGMHTPFGGQGVIRDVYLVILWTHIPLAAAIAVLVPCTFAFALRGNIERHRAWARWTFPIWLYVSVTGVLVYLFLYQWWPSGGAAV